MGLPGCLWFCHLSGKNKLAWATLLNALGFATDFFQVTGKWVTCPCDLQTPPLFQGKAISRAFGQGKEQHMHREQAWGPSLPPTLPYPLISYTHSSVHWSKIHWLTPTLCATACAWHSRELEQRQAGSAMGGAFSCSLLAPTCKWTRQRSGKQERRWLGSHLKVNYA